MNFNRNAWLRERRQRKLLAGICYDCSEPALPDNPRCQKHRQQAMEFQRRYCTPERNRERYLAAKARGYYSTKEPKKPC
jgi:hypothetical protein